MTVSLPCVRGLITPNYLHVMKTAKANMEFLNFFFQLIIVFFAHFS